MIDLFDIVAHKDHKLQGEYDEQPDLLTGGDFKFDFNGTEIDAAQISGATFTIKNMESVKDLPAVLGLR